jgi:HTH-type transcriptional repressor of NAD biosynthesis genes
MSRTRHKLHTTLKRATGLVIGKFMPPHAGHLRLIAAAQAQVGQLYVVVFSKSHEPILGAVRLAWLCELLPGARVLHVDREGPVDFDDPDAWNYWVSAIREVLPRDPDLVFSSESYGAELALRLGAQHVLVDPARSQVPISATQIRERPLAHWGFIPPPVRPYYVRRVAILGAKCTGKTTLARALAARFQTVWVPEYAREFVTSLNRPCTPTDMLTIARGQTALEERLAREADRLLVCDTNVLTTQIWYEHYFGRCPPELVRLANERAADLALLCAPDVPWTADGLRDSPQQREWFHERFLKELAARGLPHVLLSGPSDRRLEIAVAAVTPLLAD